MSVNKDKVKVVASLIAPLVIIIAGVLGFKVPDEAATEKIITLTLIAAVNITSILLTLTADYKQVIRKDGKK